MMKDIISLSEGWRYKAKDNDSGTADLRDWQSAQPLPTSIHLDLIANGTIPDPFLAKNEKLVQWVGTKTWVYEKSFTVPSELCVKQNQNVVLVFEGLDTHTTVTLNGKLILETRNMFLSHRVDITEQVRATLEHQVHALQITFHNAAEKAVEEMEAHPEHSWFSFHFGNKRLALRKAQYHFGWDWSPTLTDCGPWKPIYLEVYETRMVDLSIETHLLPNNEAGLDISLELEGKADFVRIEIEREGISIEARVIHLSGKSMETNIRVADPRLWWPWTIGEPNLYIAKATLFRQEEGSGNVTVLDSMEKRFGIRKVELVQQPLQDQEGTSFFFRINNVPIFAAGSCWVPMDSFVSRGTSERYRNWVQLAKNTNQVMIRVWGGGIYEYDELFDACDELGILIWHDFMFACGIYPGYSSFEENVMTEARQNIIRLRHHPSLVIWCGNNEDYAIAYLGKAYRGVADYDPAEMDVETIKQSGFPGRLFYEVRLPKLCKELIPGTPYWPGSPFGGIFCNADSDGDVHQWQVWHLDKYPYQDYPRLSGRMVTEFGLQSIPHWKTVEKYYPIGEFSLDDSRDCTTDEYMVWHNKGNGGPENILKYGTDNIAFDTNTIRGYIYCSQLIQSEGISTAYRSWRRMWQGPGQEYCAGALVWQLNDCWPVSSWSIADCDLRPKMAYWTMKRENQPITAGVARTVKSGSLELEAWACNMTLDTIRISYRIQAWNVRTGQNIWSLMAPSNIDLAPNRSTEIGKFQVDTNDNDKMSLESRELVFAIYLASVPKDSLTKGGGMDNPSLARYVNFHEPLKEVPMGNQEGRVNAKLIQNSTGFAIELRSSVPTKGVYLDFEDETTAGWEDNGVDLVPGEVVNLGVKGLEAPKKKRLRVYWLGESGWQSQVIVV